MHFYFIRNKIVNCITWMIVFECVWAFNNDTLKCMMLEEEQLLKGRFINIGRSSRKSRFLNFHKTDEELTVGMELSMPIITIPIKKTIDSATGMIDYMKKAEIKFASVAIMSVAIIGTTFILPGLLQLFTVKQYIQQDYYANVMGRRSSNDFSKESDEHWFPPSQPCIGRVVCTLVKRSINAIDSGKNANAINIINSLMTGNTWLRETMEDTIFKEAITHGYNRENCFVKYADCKMNWNALNSYMKNISTKLLNL